MNTSMIKSGLLALAASAMLATSALAASQWLNPVTPPPSPSFVS